MHHKKDLCSVSCESYKDFKIFLPGWWSGVILAFDSMWSSPVTSKYSQDKKEEVVICETLALNLGQIKFI